MNPSFSQAQHSVPNGGQRGQRPGYRWVAIAALVALALAGSQPAAAEPQQLAGLWKFLHGDPPAPPAAPAPKQLATVSSAAGVAADADVEGFLRAFAAALKARDGKPTLGRLSAKYTIDDLPDGRNAPDMYLQAIQQIPGPEEIVVVGVERRADLRIAKIEMRYASTGAKPKTLHFDAAGKLVWSDLFKLQVKRAGA